jgi:hypothetical protein
MKPTDQTLQRLLNAAAKAVPQAAAPPFGLETRVLARWRAGSADDESVSLFAFFRRATLGAALVLVLCATWTLTRTGDNAIGDEAALLDYHIQTSLTP